MGVFEVLFTGTVDQDVSVNPVKGRRKNDDGSPAWQGRMVRVSGKYWLGSLWQQSLDDDGKLKPGIDPALLGDPIANQDYFEMHGITLISSFEDDHDSQISGSLIGLRAGDQVSFRGSISLEAAERGIAGQVNLPSQIRVVQKASTNGHRPDRTHLVMVPAKDKM